MSTIAPSSATSTRRVHQCKWHCAKRDRRPQRFRYNIVEDRWQGLEMVKRLSRRPEPPPARMYRAGARSRSKATIRCCWPPSFNLPKGEIARPTPTINWITTQTCQGSPAKVPAALNRRRQFQWSTGSEASTPKTRRGRRCRRRPICIH